VVGANAPIRCSRRALLGGAASAAGTAALAGCGNSALRTKIENGASVPRADVATLNALLDVEHWAIAAYAVGIPMLGEAAQLVGKQFLGQELAHAVELGDLVKAAGEKPRKRASSYDLGTPPRDAAEAFAFLQRAERRQLDAYLQMIPQLSSGRVRATIATIFANDAQHLAVLRLQAGQPLPGAFTFV
jgi:hypothetical protein